MRRPHSVKLPGPKWFLRNFNYSTITGSPTRLRAYYISTTESLTDVQPVFLVAGSTPKDLMFGSGAVKDLYSMEDVMRFVDAAGAILVDERIDRL